MRRSILARTSMPALLLLLLAGCGGSDQDAAFAAWAEKARTALAETGSTVTWTVDGTALTQVSIKGGDGAGLTAERVDFSDLTFDQAGNLTRAGKTEASGIVLSDAASPERAKLPTATLTGMPLAWVTQDKAAREQALENPYTALMPESLALNDVTFTPPDGPGTGRIAAVTLNAGADPANRTITAEVKGMAIAIPKDQIPADQRETMQALQDRLTRDGIVTFNADSKFEMRVTPQTMTIRELSFDLADLAELTLSMDGTMRQNTTGPIAMEGLKSLSISYVDQGLMQTLKQDPQVAMAIGMAPMVLASMQADLPPEAQPLIAEVQKFLADPKSLRLSMVGKGGAAVDPNPLSLMSNPAGIFQAFDVTATANQ